MGIERIHQGLVEDAEAILPVSLGIELEAREVQIGARHTAQHPILLRLQHASLQCNVLDVSTIDEVDPTLVVDDGEAALLLQETVDSSLPLPHVPRTPPP